MVAERLVAVAELLDPIPDRPPAMQLGDLIEAIEENQAFAACQG